MRALIARADRTGPQLEDVQPPPLGADDIRVRVTAAAVNPADNWVASGGIRDVFDLPPAIGIGYDLSGTVVEVGEAVTDLNVGQVVAALHDDVAASARAHADVATVPARAAAAVPDGMDPLAAASVPLNALTAAQAIDLLGAPAGRSLIVTGAAGGVGGYAVALAARAGWQVTALARPEDEDFVRRAGAASLVTALPGPGFDAVLDAAALQEAAIGVVRDGGTFVGVLPAVPVPATRGIEVSAVMVRADGARLTELLALSHDGTLEVRVAGQLPLAEAATAYDKVAGGGQRGRWLLIP